MSLTKPKHSAIARQMAKIAEAVKNGIELKVMRADGDTIYLFKAMFPSDAKAQETYVKNLYYYAVLDKLIAANDAFYLKDIETEALIAFYKNKKVMIA